MLLALTSSSLTCSNFHLVAALRLFGTTAVRQKWGDRFIPEKAELDKCPPGYKEFPERDLVNYPRIERTMFPPKTRLGFIPDSFFNFFYKKTGVTGPYMFGLGLTTFLFNKELYVVTSEHKFVMAFIIVNFIFFKMAAKPTAKFAYENLTEYYAGVGKEMVAFQSKVKTKLDASSDLLARCEGWTEMLFQAQRDQVFMMMEAEYRQRLVEYKSAVKRKLDYLIDMDDSKKRFQRRHIVDWVVGQVKSSVDDQVQKAVFSQCLVNLKTLSARTQV